MDTVETIGRLLIALAVVLGTIWFLARRLRTGGARQKLRSDKLIDVLGRQSLSRNSSVAVVRVAGNALIVGVTDSNVRVLGEVPLDSVQSWLAAAAPAPRRSPEGAPLSAADIDLIRAARAQSPDDAVTAAREPAGPLAGSALSPATWRQTLNTLRDMTARKG